MANTPLYVVIGSIEGDGSFWLRVKYYEKMKMTEKTIQGMGKSYKISKLNQVSRGNHPDTWRVLTVKESDIEQSKQLLLEFLVQLMEKRIVKQKENIVKMEKTLEEKNYLWDTYIAK